MSYKEYKKLLNTELFKIPLYNKSESLTFPEYLKSIHDSFLEIYEQDLIEDIERKTNYIGAKDGIFRRMKLTSYHLQAVIKLYYKGHILEATNKFNWILDRLIDIESVIDQININENFYRARISNSQEFSKEDLFHIKFENRHFVNTCRYSVPGFPALYLGDSAYTCWEEFNRPNLRQMWFSRFTNSKILKVIKILRFEDLQIILENLEEDKQSLEFTKYLQLFPLFMSCSIKVKHKDGGFKPEYIIPQLLLQYVSKNNKIDGIMFPSTKVKYSNIFEMSAYNYVFPTKAIQNKGFCSELKKIFQLTEPSNLELEQILDDPINRGSVSGFPLTKSKEKIALINEQKSPYSHTSFGKIEYKLKHPDRKLHQL